MLKVINLYPLRYAFKQYDFLRFVPSIFLTLTSRPLSGVEGQGGNQGILASLRELKVLPLVDV